MSVYDVLARARSQGRRTVLVTVVEVGGDAPSQPGAKLVVDERGEVLAGTLGCSEFDTAGVALATEALAGGGAGGTPGAGGTLRRRVEFAGHGRERALEVFAEVHEPVATMVVLGATPVGRAVAELARFTGRRAVLVAPGGDASLAGTGVEVEAVDPRRYLEAVPPGELDAVLVSDHDAAWAQEALRVVLAGGASFVGMLGSRRHAPDAVRRLREAGVPEEHIARLRSPVGLDIGSRTPEEIALSIMAEVVAVERGRDGGRMGLDWSAE